MGSENEASSDVDMESEVRFNLTSTNQSTDHIIGLPSQSQKTQSRDRTEPKC